MLYFQLDGYFPQLRWTHDFWDDGGLSKFIIGPLSPLSGKNPDGKVELVLGLKSTGASHLFITMDDAAEVAAANRLSYPNPSSANPAHDLESLSPIIFASSEELHRKLKTLKPKKKGGVGQANRNYPDDGLVLYRAAFEQGRLCYQILTKAVDPGKFSVDDISWTPQLRIASFVFNVKGLESRTTQQRKSNPDVLDFGFCEASLPDLNANVSTATHIVNLRNKLLGRKQPKRPFHHGNSNEVEYGDIPLRIQEIFKSLHSESSSPVILLVCREEETMNLLRNLGVDISRWRSGIHDLLWPNSRRVSRFDGPSRSKPSSHKYSPTHQRYSNRSRSRSPNSRSEQTSTSRYDDKPVSLPARTTFAPVYVVDVRELYRKLMQVFNVDGVVDISNFFKLTDDKGWCAGNEAVMIFNVWKEMVSSLPIDEQRDLRRTMLGQPPVSSSSEASEAYVYDSDDDRDPNDIVQPQPAQKEVDPYGFDESDDSDED